jgi:hypothetical protein
VPRPPESAAGGPHPYGPPQPPSIDLETDITSLPRGVVDLAAWRWRVWPGYWGTWHLATWSVAERSRRAS